jgi:NTP pyrophosphatase (non-canonical NTP hydrolase)
MQFQDYSTQAISTDLYDKNGQAIDSHAMLEKVFGLVGEAGEVAEKFKKILRDKNGIATDEDKKELMKELGDVLWYINSVGIYLGYSLDEIAQNNLDKVLSRKDRGVTRGSGDNR